MKMLEICSVTTGQTPGGDFNADGLELTSPKTAKFNHGKTPMKKNESPKFIRFKIDGRPVPKMRPRQNYHTPKKTREWETKIAYEAAKQCGLVGDIPHFDGDVHMAILFNFTNKRHGDLSNLVKSVEDALEGKKIKARSTTTLGGKKLKKGDSETVGMAYKNDKAIKALITHLRTDADEPGVEILIADASIDGWALLSMEMVKWAAEMNLHGG